MLVYSTVSVLHSHVIFIFKFSAHPSQFQGHLGISQLVQQGLLSALWSWPLQFIGVGNNFVKVCMQSRSKSSLLLIVTEEAIYASAPFRHLFRWWLICFSCMSAFHFPHEPCLQICWFLEHSIWPPGFSLRGKLPIALFTISNNPEPSDSKVMPSSSEEFFFHHLIFEDL